MALDLNKEENQYELIPSGTRAVVRMIINQPEASRRCQASPALTQSATSDAQYLDCIFEVASGKYKGKKVYQNYTVAGGKTDDNGNSKAARISGQFLKAAWDAHKGLLPTDMSEQAVHARMLKDYTEFHDIHFPVTICIKEQTGGYKDKNEIYHVITPDKPEYAILMSGKDVEPLPLGIIAAGGKKKAAGGPGAAGVSTKPAWAQDTPAGAQQSKQSQAAGADTPIDPAKAATAGFTPPPVQQQTDNRPAWAR